MTTHLLIMKDLLGGEPAQSDEKRLAIKASKLEEYFQCFLFAFVYNLKVEKSIINSVMN